MHRGANTVAKATGTLNDDLTMSNLACAITLTLGIPYRNATPDNVLAQQSSFCKRALQAFALHEMKMVPRNDCRIDEKICYRFSFF